jgi:hypothetical protein
MHPWIKHFEERDICFPFKESFEWYYLWIGPCWYTINKNATILIDSLHKNFGVPTCTAMLLAISNSFLVVHSTMLFCFGVLALVNCLCILTSSHNFVKSLDKNSPPQSLLMDCISCFIWSSIIVLSTVNLVKASNFLCKNLTQIHQQLQGNILILLLTLTRIVHIGLSVTILKVQWLLMCF